MSFIWSVIGIVVSIFGVVGVVASGRFLWGMSNQERKALVTCNVPADYIEKGIGMLLVILLLPVIGIFSCVYLYERLTRKRLY